MGHVDQLIDEFVASGKDSAALPSKLTGAERKYAHMAAGMRQLGHESKGKGKQRAIWLSRDAGALQSEDRRLEEGQIHEYLFAKTYIGLTGPYVTAVGRQFEKSVVPATHCAGKVKRDGSSEGHITLLSSNDVKALCAERSVSRFELLLQISLDLEDDWRPLGLSLIHI